MYFSCFNYNQFTDETDSEFETSLDETRTEQKRTSEPISVSGDEEDEISSSQESEKRLQSNMSGFWWSTDNFHYIITWSLKGTNFWYFSVVLEESMLEDEEEITLSQAVSYLNNHSVGWVQSNLFIFHIFILSCFKICFLNWIQNRMLQINASGCTVLKVFKSRLNCRNL